MLRFLIFFFRFDPFFFQALVSYQKALQVLGSRKNNPDVWDTVTWELSTALFNLATIAQDCPGPSVKVSFLINASNSVLLRTDSVDSSTHFGSTRVQRCLPMYIQKQLK